MYSQIYIYIYINYKKKIMMKKNNKYNINRLQLLQMRFFRKSHKYNLSLSTEFEEIIIGSLLGDLHAEKISE